MNKPSEVKESLADKTSREAAEARRKAEVKKLEAQIKADAERAKNAPQKSWEKLDKKIPHIQKLVENVESSAKSLVDNLNELNDALFEAYQTAPKVDTSSFASSPLGASKVWQNLKIHLMKIGLKNLGSMHNLHTLNGFKQTMTDGLLWLVKLKEGDQLYGTREQRERQQQSKRSAGK
jgi:hypothetical protein